MKINYICSFNLAFLTILIHSNSLYANDLRSFPKLKSGEWEMSVKNNILPKGLPAILSQMKMLYCIDETTQDKMITQSEEKSDCKHLKIMKQGNKYLSDFECLVEGNHIKGRSETIFVSDIQIDNKVNMDRPGQPTINLTSNAKFKGACKNGMKPGDVRLLTPGGGEFSPDNIEAIKKMGEALSQFDIEQ